MSSVDSAITRLKALALASTDLTIKYAPSYPVSDATVFPLVITHLSSGEADAIADWGELRPIISVDFFFSLIDLKQAYTEADACAIEYARRIAGDPTLNSSVDTVIFPISWEVAPTEYNGIPALMLSFSIPVKTMENKIT